MKALVLKRYHDLVYEDVPEPNLGPFDVLIQVKACGICGSDVHGMDGSTGRRIPPIIMGHEAAGVIVRVGENVAGWKPGDRVTFDSTLYCGECFFCRRGQINLCDHRMVLGVSCREYRRHGAFAEYVAVPARVLHRLPEALPFEQAAMVEALSIAVHAVERTPRRLNDSVLVVGAGTIGLLIIQVLRVAGCGRIFAADLDQSRLDLALRLGADEGLRPDKDDVPAAVRANSQGRGADAAFDAVGLSTTLQAALAALRKGGALTLVGNLSAGAEFPLQAAVTRELSLRGSCASSGEYPACLEMLERGTIRTNALLSAVAPLAEGAAWFDRLRKKEPGLFKVVLVP